MPDDDEEDEKEDEEEEQEDESEEEAEESDDDEGSGISSLSSESRKRKVDDARPVDKNSRKTDEAGANSGEETGEEEDMPAAKKTPQRRDISVAYRTVAPAPVPEQGAAESRKRKADTAQAASEQKKRKEDNVGSGTDEPIPTSAKKKTPEKPVCDCTCQFHCTAAVCG